MRMVWSWSQEGLGFYRFSEEAEVTGGSIMEEWLQRASGKGEGAVLFRVVWRSSGTQIGRAHV